MDTAHGENKNLFWYRSQDSFNSSIHSKFDVMIQFASH